MLRYNDISWERMILAVEKVRDRLTRAAEALEKAKIPYAVVEGNAVAAWVARIDVAAVRNTQDVDVLLKRGDMEAAKAAMAAYGFIYSGVHGHDMFLDGPSAGPRDAVHVIYAGEKVRPTYIVPAPDVSESELLPPFRLINLEALVRMKLTSFRDKDRTHLRDMIDVGLVDASWCDRLPPALAHRLSELLATPDG
jgi:hypothetical protein